MFRKNIKQDKLTWKTGKTVERNMSFAPNNDKIVQFDIISSPVFDQDNHPIRLLVTGQLAQNSQKRTNQLELLTSVFSTSHLSFIILDKSLKITSANGAFSSLLDYSLDDVKNRPIFCIINSKPNDDFCVTLKTYFRENNHRLWAGNIDCKKKKRGCHYRQTGDKTHTE